MGLTNSYVFELCKKLKLNVIGVVPCNTTISLRKNDIIIFNLDEKHKPGSHFICVHCDGKNVYYFDPIGFKCYNPYIMKILMDTKLPIFEYEFPIQSLFSNFCGYFCIAFAIKASLKMSDNLFFDQFDCKNHSNNDEAVVQIIINYIKNHLFF